MNFFLREPQENCEKQLKQLKVKLMLLVSKKYCCTVQTILIYLINNLITWVSPVLAVLPKVTFKLYWFKFDLWTICWQPLGRERRQTSEEIFQRFFFKTAIKMGHPWSLLSSNPRTERAGFNCNWQHKIVRNVFIQRNIGTKGGQLHTFWNHQTLIYKIWVKFTIKHRHARRARDIFLGFKKASEGGSISVDSYQ